MHISIEEFLKHLYVSLDNIQTSFLANIFVSKKCLNSAFLVVLWTIGEVNKKQNVSTEMAHKILLDTIP